MSYRWAVCKTCKNMGTNTAICDTCDAHYSNYRGAKPITNADRIRQMTDEELAQEIWACHVFDTFHTLLWWLKQEVDDAVD